MTTAQLTSIGKYLRKLRVDNNEIMDGMAKRLGVKATQLSAVERGKRNFKESWLAILQEEYKLNEKEYAELVMAVYESSNKVSITYCEEDAELAMMLSENIHKMSNEKKKEILEILKGDNV